MAELGPLQAPTDPKDPRWGFNIGQLLMQLWTEKDTQGNPLTATAIERIGNVLTRASQQYPNEFNPIAEHVASQFDFAPPGDNQQQILDMFNSLANALSSGSSARQRVESVIRNIEQNTQRTTQQTSVTGSVENVTGQRRTTRFVDVPTPDEFLNDFQTVFTSYITSNYQQGAISLQDAQSALGSPELFLDLYLKELTARALRGENIFRVVGISGENKVLGERFGGITTEETTSKSSQLGTTTEKSKTTGESKSTETQQVSGGGGAQPYSEAEKSKKTFDETVTSQQQQTAVQSQTIAEQEALVQRPNLTTVFALSPNQFLSEQFDPAKLTTFISGRRGTEQRVRETATGGFTSSPRRTF